MRARTAARSRVAAAGTALVLCSAAATSPADPRSADGCGAVQDAPILDSRRGVMSLRTLPVDDVIRAVVVHDEPPSAATVAAMRQLGVTAQALRHLPMSLVEGEVHGLLEVARLAGVRDLHPDRRLELHSRSSARAIGADRVWADFGVTGAGIGVAVVDSGLDATHPAFDGRVRRNVKVVGPGYVESTGVAPPQGAPAGDVVVAFHDTPYSNTDPSGHGTHVAGIVAAADVAGDEEDSPVGVAPGAHLVAYAVGEVSVVTAIAAFDDILEHREGDAIRVVNNSWGDRFSRFDPHDPINVATRSLHDAGIVVTFPAGNDGEEMTLNPFAAAPWVIGVGSSSLAGAPSVTTSGGLRYDNAWPMANRDAHARFKGDRLGMYHPDVIAPGDAIVSTATFTGGTTRSTGSSMASPHVAGVAALLLEARPALTPGQIERILEVTATPVGNDGPWRSGFGAVDAHAAVALATSGVPDADAWRRRHRARVRELTAQRERPVRSSDHWTVVAGAPVGAAGTERHCLAFHVGPGTAVLRATVAFAGTGDGIPVSGVPNRTEWSLTVRDADGTQVAGSRPSRRTGVAAFDVDLGDLDREVAFGAWTAELVSELAHNAPRPLYSPEVSVVVTQLGPRRDRPVSRTTTWDLPLIAGVGSLPAATSPEGCPYVAPGTEGALGTTSGTPCAAKNVGVVWTDAAGMSSFVSEPLTAPTTLSGTGSLVLHLADESYDAWGPQGAPRILGSIEVLPSDASRAATVTDIGVPARIGTTPVRGTYALAFAPTALPVGSRLRLRFEVSGAQASAVRLLHGGPYDSRLSLHTSPTSHRRSNDNRRSTSHAYEEALRQGAGAAAGLAVLGLQPR